ncbi:MAG TPA: hypothetical protein DCE56_02305 [Cyanobacteria bacterium UBA8553]|nr:hypothetical protein [Cyanobacteria bacterium UBA8553]
MTPLNDLFPNGVPVVGIEPTLFLGEDREPCWELDLDGLPELVLNRLLKIANADKMPLAVTFTLMFVGVFLIPENWCEVLL